MRIALLSLIVVFAALAACSEASEPLFEPPEGGITAPVEAVTGALSFNVMIDSQSQEIRLAMLETPEAEATRAALEAALQGQQVIVSPLQEDADRYGRLIAKVWTRTEGAEMAGQSLQRHMIETGWARVLSYPDNAPDDVAALLALEAEARAEGRGLWADPDYRVRDTDPDMLIQDVGRLQLVQGRIMDIAILQSGRTYLNFGSDWRTDFTIRIDARDAPLFEAAGLDLASLEGRLVRVRGIIRDENGPMVRLVHPLRLEILEAGPEE